MKVLLIPILLLAGCTPPLDTYQRALDTYATNASDGDLESTLTGSALQTAKQSQDLLREIGWIQVGKSRFEDTKLAGESTVVSCLDVSGVSFIDVSGRAISPQQRDDRLLMQIEFSKSNPPLIADLREVGEC